MEYNYLALAIPIFLVLIGIELLVARKRGQRWYRFSDSITDLSCAVLQQMMELVTGATLLVVYAWVHARFGILEIPLDSIPGWIAAFLAVDLVYYWFHRKSHEVGAIWAAHVVHHQSEDFNFAVALRQSTFQPFLFWFFYLPLAVVGVPPLMFVVSWSVSLVYQFWIHTRAIGRLGPLEWVLNTPSHHRVHHGRNPKYLDKNYGGILIIWDRLFGTFEPEAEEPVYGVVEPYRSWNPVWANLGTWVALYRTASKMTRWQDKVQLLFKPPGWRPASFGGPLEPPEVEHGAPLAFDPPLRMGIRNYVLVQFFPVIAATAVVMFFFTRLGLPVKILAPTLLLVSTLSCGGLLEERPWALPLELSRLGAVAISAALLLPAGFTHWGAGPLLVTVLLAAIGSTWWLWRVWHPVSGIEASTARGSGTHPA